jgi:hypothetical protein
MGESIVKGAKGTKRKVHFKGLHTTHVIFVLVYNFIICILSTPLAPHFKYKYILIKKLFYTIYIMHSCPLSHKHEQLLLKTHFQNP